MSVQSRIDSQFVAWIRRRFQLRTDPKPREREHWGFGVIEDISQLRREIAVLAHAINLINGTVFPSPRVTLPSLDERVFKIEKRIVPNGTSSG